MDEKPRKYILLNDRVGQLIEKGLLSFSTKNIPTQFLRGELLEALLEADQPKNPEKIALTSLTNKQQRVECSTSEVTKLTDSETDLLWAITSAEERLRNFRERNRLDSIKLLTVGSKVLVKLKNLPRDSRGVIWYIGALPTNNGTMFGVELLSKEALGQGTTDGTFRDKQYFTCPQDCGVFIAMDKIRPFEELPRSPKKETHSNVKSKLSSIKDTLSSGFKSKPQETSLPGYNDKLKIDQRVIVYVDEKPILGHVRYIADTLDASGGLPVGIELQSRMGSGTGVFQGSQRFVCKKDFALFVPASTVIPEEDFYGYHEKERLSKSDGLSSVSLGYDVNYGASSESTSKLKRSNSITSPTSRSSDDPVQMVTGQSTGPQFIREQKDVLKSIKAEYGSTPGSKSENFPEQNAGTIDFHDEHFNKSPRTSTDSYMRIHPGNSIFYPQKRDTASNFPTEVQDSQNDCYGDFQMVHATSNTADNHSIEARLEGTVVSTSDGHVQHHLSSEMQTDVVMDAVPNIQDSNAELKDDEDKKRLVARRLGLELGSMVEVPLMNNNKKQYGVIRWIGELPELRGRLVAGLELEEEQAACSDGVFNGVRYFTCPPGRGFFVNLTNCRRDSRFQPESPVDVSKYSSKAFGSLDSPIVEGTIPPPPSLVREHQGRMRGIQGHHNSCYLDATLYSMFAFTPVFDTLLYRSKTEDDLEEYETVQKVLKDGIVNPLRSTGYVRADRVLQLRQLLDKLGSTSGLMNEEKDPEEFLNTLLQQVLKSESLLKLKTPNSSRCEESNYYQIITEKDEMVQLASVQKLLEQSFLFSDLKLAEVPSCMILQMPRFGNKYKMYDLILPDLHLDISHILENVPRECSICGADASTFECKECYQTKQIQPGIPSFCEKCDTRWHMKNERLTHQRTPITVPKEYRRLSTSDSKSESKTERHIEKHVMELFAVVCIATSHYVAFVKCGLEADSPWCFFDSMADRKGEKNGYNIPMVTLCPEATKWLNAKPEEIISAKNKDELPPTMKRLFGDAYMCLYQDIEMTMYK